MNRPSALFHRIGFISAFMLVALASLLCISGCQGANQAPSSSSGVRETINDFVVRSGAALASIDERMFWGNEESLWVADIAADGGIEDVECLGEFDDRVRRVAAYNDELYVLTISGIYRLGYDDDVSLAEHLVPGDSADDMWVSSEGLFYREDDTLSFSDLDGESSREIATGVDDFALVNGGIFILSEDGSLVCSDLSGENTLEIEAAAARDEDVQLIVDGNDVYVASNDLLVCREGEDKLESVGLSHELGDPKRVVVSEGLVLYESAAGNPYRHVDGDEEDELLDHGIFWGRPYSLVLDGRLYFAMFGDDITVVDLDSLEWEDYKIDDFEDDDLDDDAEAGSSEYIPAESGADTSGSFDIAANLKVYGTSAATTLRTDHFALMMDRIAMEAGLWDIVPTSDTTISFYYTGARDAGYDGLVFTLRAYDWGDNSYSELPSWHLAGQDEEKKYVVILPTDVRYDSSNGAQAEEYARMRSFAESMDMNANADGNPFVVLD